jgi:leucyl/phenylalanyl-tRNA--protein transferase
MRRRFLPHLSPTDSPAALPDPALALDVPNGLLAAGGALTPDWLLGAYRRGIFPWFSEEDPILWWSPDPRAVFDPETFRPSRSLRQSLRNRGYETRINTAFAAVIRGCAAPRREDSGTWITPKMVAAYERLHELGHAHSVETWCDGALAGGLYGLRIGGLFCGESMYAEARDASKVALVRLLTTAAQVGIRLVDCQLPNPHLLSLGAETVPRAVFLDRMRPLVDLTENARFA